MTFNTTHNWTSAARAKAPAMALSICVLFGLEQPAFGKRMGCGLDPQNPGSEWESVSA